MARHDAKPAGRLLAALGLAAAQLQEGEAGAVLRDRLGHAVAALHRRTRRGSGAEQLGLVAAQRRAVIVELSLIGCLLSWLGAQRASWRGGGFGGSLIARPR